MKAEVPAAKPEATNSPEVPSERLREQYQAKGPPEKTLILGETSPKMAKSEPRFECIFSSPFCKDLMSATKDSGNGKESEAQKSGETVEVVTRDMQLKMKSCRKSERGNKGKKVEKEQGSGKTGGRKPRSKKPTRKSKNKKRRMLQQRSPQALQHLEEIAGNKKRKAETVENTHTPRAQAKAKPAPKGKAKAAPKGKAKAAPKAPKTKAKAAPKGKAKAKARGRPKVEVDPCDSMKTSPLFDPQLVQEFLDFAHQFSKTDKVTSQAFKLRVRTLVPQCVFVNYRLNLYWTTTRCGVTDTATGSDVQSFSFNTPNAHEPWRVAVSSLCACKTATGLL